MSRWRLLAAVAAVLAGLTLAVLGINRALTAADTAVPWSTFGIGGQPSESDDFELGSTVGQSSPIGESASASLGLEAGFVYGWGPNCVAAVDTDGDGFKNGAECVIGTDCMDDCTDQPLDRDAWPPDLAGPAGCGYPDTNANILDLSCFKPKLNYCESEGGYDSRYNLEFTESAACTPTEQQVNILDVLMYKPVLGASCANP